MGPTNDALVRLFNADQALRQAQAKYDRAARDVRLQEKKLVDLQMRLSAARQKLKETQAHSSNVELEIKSRESRIDKLRVQQQTAKNHKEYQTFLIEINTAKVDRGHIEEDLLKLMELLETHQADVVQLQALIDAETQKLQTLKDNNIERLAVLSAEIDALRPVRDEVAAHVPSQALAAFERLAGHFDGESMAAIQKPDPRDEDIICGSCNMSLMVDIYNRLFSRDDLVFCPSCHRILYIPHDLPVGTPAKDKEPKKTRKNKKAQSGIIAEAKTAVAAEPVAPAPVNDDAEAQAKKTSENQPATENQSAA